MTRWYGRVGPAIAVCVTLMACEGNDEGASSTAANQQWLRGEHAERKAAATKLAKGVVEALP